MLSGKAYAIALRGHLRVDQVLSSIMFEKMIDYYNLNKDEVIKSLDGLYSDIVSSKINIADFENDSFMKSVDQQNQSYKSRTATLWSEYQNVIQVIRKLITADRIGNWNLQAWNTTSLTYFCSSWSLQLFKISISILAKYATSGNNQFFCL